jgi:hypothetical protein
VLHNSILVSRTYGSPIEYRFPHTTGVIIANNVLDGNILARDGAAGTVTGNYTAASPALFVNPAGGDMHVSAAAAAALLDMIVTPRAAALLDWDGEPRPSGATDIGADEAVSPLVAPRNLRVIR